MLKSQAPTSVEAKRLAIVMHRQITTRWNEREIKAFLSLLPITEEDLSSLERYYKKHWPPCRDKNVLRHDLSTLLNHFNGEVDRAKIWCEAHPIKPPPRKIIPLPTPPEAQMTEDEKRRAFADFEKLMGRKPQL